MKKIIFTFSAFVLLCISVVAQEVSTQNNLSNKFYFRYALSTPTNSNYEYSNWSNEFTEKKGGAIEFGSFLYFNKLNLGSKSKLGLNISFLSASKHKMGTDYDKVMDLLKDELDDLTDELDDFGGLFDGTMDETTDQTTDQTGDENFDSELLFYPQTTFYNIGSKFGLIYSYNIWDKVNVDAFANINPVWLNVAIVDEQTGPLTYNIGSLGLKYSFGLNVRYDFIMLGIELNMGELKYLSLDHKADTYIGNTQISYDSETLEPILPSRKETNSSCLNLSLGFCF